MNFDLVGIFGARATTIIAAIAADVVMGVALALHKQEFEWRKVLRFYKTMVGPYLLGYLAFAILVEFAAPDLLGEYQFVAEQATISAVWLLIMKVVVIDSFLKHAKELYDGLKV